LRYIDSIAAASALIWLAGCAPAPAVTILEPVGPAPAGQAKVLGQGSLQVYSARQKEPLAAEFREWQWDYELGKNAFTYGLAHFSGNWKPKDYFTNADVVWLPDGQIAGWLAAY
jgi:hypothetical protein